MGSYSTLRVNGFDLYSVKSDVDPMVMRVFCESDKRVRPLAPHDVRYFPTGAGSGGEDESWDEAPAMIVEYTIDLRTATDRLELMGFTLPRVKDYFHRHSQDELNTLAERKKQPPWTKEELQRILSEEESLLRTLSFEMWLQCFGEIVRTRPKLASFSGRWWEPDDGGLSPLMRYMLGNSRDGFYGFPVCDARVFLRAVAEAIGSRGELTYDLTDLVTGGYVEAEENLCAWSRRELAEAQVIDHKIVVLTEGKTDKTVLDGALRLLYPHLADYYSFMDFDAARPVGGVGALVNTVKAFIGAGIVNRTVAFFDNDTAAKAALRSLRDITIPNHVRVLTYPDIELARRYPTLGPQGLAFMDANGLAGSIELYLGEDVLRKDDGSLTPVQWRGYDQSMQQYQGEVLDKDRLLGKFTEKLRTCQSWPSRIKEFDWTGMLAILDQLRTAFHDAPHRLEPL